MQEITKKQLETLFFIREYSNNHLYPPTVIEIANALEVQGNAIQGRLVSLDKKGYITKQDKKARSIVITDKGSLALYEDF